MAYDIYLWLIKWEPHEYVHRLLTLRLRKLSVWGKRGSLQGHSLMLDQYFFIRAVCVHHWAFTDSFITFIFAEVRDYICPHPPTYSSFSSIHTDTPRYQSSDNWPHTVPYVTVCQSRSDFTQYDSVLHSYKHHPYHTASRCFRDSSISLSLS